MMILFVKLTKGIGHKFYQLMKSSPMLDDINLSRNRSSIALVQTKHNPVYSVHVIQVMTDFN